MTTFFDYLRTSNKYVDGEWDESSYFDDEFHCVKYKISNNGGWLHLNSLKNSVDAACHTLSNNTSQFLNSPNMGELRHNFPDYFKVVNGAVWMRVEMFAIYDVIQDMFKRNTAYACWKLGEVDWQSHLFEFIYIRCDPKFKLIDWIVKGGREMNPPARENGYWHHAVEDGCGTVYALFVVKYGSPAESTLKKVFADLFTKAPKKVDGKKTGTEYYRVPGVNTKESFELKIIEAINDFSKAMDDLDELIDVWDYQCEKYLGVTSEDFIYKYMPWLKLPKHKLGERE